MPVQLWKMVTIANSKHNKAMVGVYMAVVVLVYPHYAGVLINLKRSHLRCQRFAWMRFRRLATVNVILYMREAEEAREKIIGGNG